ncbi:HAD superfamily hydrolase (TIGR01450 family) [Kibdelosporangium banguiense]|uniref:HAD superfamily hydrolase (TIGR01450 family) n=1 Tax=Kibdelosporangium banguiense TaxID=1365924 RepID=A0ABS4TK33_9PSEU|nr:HAD-IIA family hydrolase [Kibdelosporangium banguiense]MBP2324674.1 HAD superfamily hydrolase (TIGR01450 family) [Kibdelosporangium banguiense]
MKRRLLDIYDALLLDLDGTVYRGGEAVPGAAQAVRAARENGTAVRFVTNNASRSPQDVADHLTNLGVSAKPEEVSTSAQAAGTVLSERLQPGDEVLVVGTTSLADIVESVGLRPVRSFTENVKAVVQGLSRDAGYRDLAEATLAIRAGALWVACNMDPTLPTERGELPGNGALVAALRAATSQEPVVAGKPARPLMDEAIMSSNANSPLVVGDRLDTDIAGAVTAEVDALLVLTGVTRPAELLAAPAWLRPRYVAASIGDVCGPANGLEIAAQRAWEVDRTDHALTVRCTGNGPSTDELALLRALCAAHRPVEGGDILVRAEDDTTRDALRTLGIARSAVP